MKKLFILLIMLSLTAEMIAQNILWETTVPGRNSLAMIKGVALDDNGDILAVGTFAGSQSGQYLPLDWLRIDSLGNLLQKDSILTGFYPTKNIAEGMLKVPGENNFIIHGVGWDSLGYLKDYIAKVDAQGQSIWHYDTMYIGNFLSTRSAIILKDKSVLTTGYVQQTSIDWDLSVRRIDSLGHLMWENNIPMPGNQEGTGITEMMDGSVIVFSNNSGDVNLLKIAFDGRVIADSLIYSQQEDVRVVSGTLTQENHILQTGIPDGFMSTSNNFNQYFNYDFINFNFLGIATDFEIVDADTNTVLVYSDGTNSKLRYSSNRNLTNIWDINLMPNGTPIISPSGIIFSSSINNILVFGTSIVSGVRNYWLAKIDGVGNEWIPDRCAFSPPVAGFEQGFTGSGILTFRDTSYAGLKYLDTVYTWEWSSSIGQSSTDSTFIMLIDTTSTTSLDVELVISNWYGCTDTVSKSFTYQTGVGLVEDIPFKASLYPNPVNNVLHIRHNGTEPGSIKLYDTQGVLRQSAHFEGATHQIDLSSLPAGIYVCQLQTGKHIETRKLVKY